MTDPNDPPQVLAREDALRAIRANEDDARGLVNYLTDHFQIDDRELSAVMDLLLDPKHVGAAEYRAIHGMLDDLGGELTHEHAQAILDEFIGHAQAMKEVLAGAPPDPIRTLEHRLDRLRPRVEHIPANREVGQDVLTDAIRLSREVDKMVAEVMPHNAPRYELRRLLAISRWMYAQGFPTAQAETFRSAGIKRDDPL